MALPLNKLLKIALPVTTVTSATILTAWLISRSPELLNEEQDKDLLLNDFEEPDEEFIEKTLSETNDEDKENREDGLSKETEAEKDVKEEPTEKSLDANELMKGLSEILPKIIEGAEKIREETVTLPKELTSHPVTPQNSSGKQSLAELSSPSQTFDSKESADSHLSGAESKAGVQVKEEQDSLPAKGEREEENLETSKGSLNVGTKDLESAGHEESASDEALSPTSPVNEDVSQREEGSELGQALQEQRAEGHTDSQSSSEGDLKPESQNDGIGESESSVSKGEESAVSTERTKNGLDQGGEENSTTEGNSNRNDFDLSEFEKLAGDLDLADLGLDKVLN